MCQIIQLGAYRAKTRKAYLARHGGRLDHFVERFVRANIDVDFAQLAADHQVGAGAWDYVEFRERLAEALDQAFGVALYRELCAQRWFNRRLITKDETIERCLSTYVLSQCNDALRNR